MQYEDLLQHVYDRGAQKEDRTGTGTKSIFGAQLRYDLSQGFPLITTKKVFFKGTAAELLWFISGSTRTEDLHECAKQWWEPWTPESGDLGPIYGQQFRAQRWWTEVTPELFDAPVVERSEGKVFGVGDLGSYRLPTGLSSPGEPEHISMLKSTWREMLRRCYHEQCASHKGYGAKGVHVDPEWLLLDNFIRDAVKLPGWEMKLAYPGNYSLDKDIRAASNRYSASTCMWASDSEQSWNVSNARPFYATSPKGEEILFPSIGEMKRLHGVNLSAVHRCLSGELGKHHGWTGFRYADAASGKVIRFRELDQLRYMVASLKFNADSRRHVIGLWNTAAMQHAALPCCHGSVIQCFVADGRLSLQVYQRSADLFIGVPVNIASYSLLTHMLAHQLDLEPGDLVWTGGDCHIYSNHMDQVKEQLRREPRPLPRLEIRRRPSNIFDYGLDDFEVVGYDPHPAIKAPVAV